MKNASKNRRQALATLFFLLALVVQVSSGFSAAPGNGDSGCSSPTVTKTGQTSNSVSFSWGTVEGATAYKAWYFRRGDNYTSQVVTTGGNSISFSSLPAGTYVFYFSTVCGGETSQAIITDDLLMD